MIRWDWYQATPLDDVPPMVVLDSIASEIEGADRIQSNRRGQNGYAKSALLLDADEHVLAIMNYEGNNGARPNLRGTGPSAPAFAYALRERYPRHNVTRADACSDLLGADFRAISDQARVMARRARTHGLSYVPDDPKRGPTYQIGSKTSVTQMRIYRKDLEMIRKGADAAEFPEPIVRIEQQVNPKGDALRLAFARCDPEDVFGASRVGRAVSEEILMNNPIAINMTRRPPSDYDIRCRWLAVQARRVLLEIRDKHPTKEQFCKFLFEDLLDEMPFSS